MSSLEGKTVKFRNNCYYDFKYNKPIGKIIRVCKNFKPEEARFNIYRTKYLVCLFERIKIDCGWLWWIFDWNCKIVKNKEERELIGEYAKSLDNCFYFFNTSEVEIIGSMVLENE